MLNTPERGALDLAPPIALRFMTRHQSCGVRKVSQLATSPDFKPDMNHRVRSADVPCVNASGTT